MNHLSSSGEGTPRVRSPGVSPASTSQPPWKALRPGQGPPLVDGMVVVWWLCGGCMVVVWWLYGGCMVVLKAGEAPAVQLADAAVRTEAVVIE